MMRVNLYDAIDKMNVCGKNAINSMSEGDEQRMLLLGMKRFLKNDPINTRDTRRRIAAALCEAGKYCF